MVEDADRDYALLTRELQKAGLDVILHRVENADQFRAALADGPWDAIVSDHSLPQFSSTIALEIAREVEREVPFIIVSGAIGEEQAVDSMKAGAQDYVSKSNLRRLIPVLEREWREAEGRSERRRAEAEVAALHRERETRLLQRSTLLDITNAVVANLDRSSLFRSIFDALRNALEFDCLMIALSGREDGQIELTSLSDGTSPEEHTRRCCKELPGEPSSAGLEYIRPRRPIAPSRSPRSCVMPACGAPSARHSRQNPSRSAS